MTEEIKRARIGVDVGGTFTDVLLIDESTGVTQLGKVPSTPDQPELAALTGVATVLRDAEVGASAVAHVMHGTTVATNAVLTGRGARVGLLTTAGFEQVLHLARGETPGPLAGWVTMVKPDPLAAVEDTRGVRERMAADGQVVAALDEVQARTVIADLIDCGVESLAISLLHAYANPAHEHRLRELAAELAPAMAVSISSDVLPEFREYERTNVVVMNAHVRPTLQEYLERMQDGLWEVRIDGSLSILRSDGGLMSVKAATEKPVHTLLSGPAGGVAGAARVARTSGHPNFLSLDMGGTSTDVALALEGEPTLTREMTLGEFPLKTPTIDVRSVGAGGGSIAHVPEVTRALRVGPESAGAIPGPAAYGRGGEDATVTDANLVLGRLPAQLLGGAMELDVDLARSAIEKVAAALRLSLEEAAEGILDVANESMVGALRLVSVEKGHDPREFALVAFGGAGPLHANALAELMGCFPVVVPPTPGVLCALGDATSPFRSEFAETYIGRFDQIGAHEIADRLAALETHANRWLDDEGVSSADREVRLELDVRYQKQGLEIPIPVDEGEIVLDAIAADFAERHEREYGFRLDTPCESVNLRAMAIGAALLDEPAAPGAAEDRALEDARLGTQQVYHRGEWHEATLYNRAGLESGHRIEGPAIVLQPDTTTLVLPGYSADVDAHRNLVIGRPEAARADRGRESPIVIDIVENALKNVRREMDAVIFRAASSTVIREEHDSFPLVADEHGRLLTGQFGWPLADFFERWPKEDLAPGDVLLMNDPYLVKGAVQHAPDMLLLRPIFVADELVGFASQFGNLTDIGGAVPGSLPVQARTIFEEGIRFPPVKLYDRGALVQPIVDILANNSRTPELTVADTLALAAATRAAELRIIELCERVGVDVYRRVCEELLDRTRRAAALMIEQFIPEEPLVFEDVVDDDGRGNGPFRIRLALSRDDDKAVLDFSGTSPQAEGPINLYMGENMFKMVTGIVLIMALDPQILFNHGYNELFEIRFPKASVIQPEFPAALSNRSHTLARIFDVLAGALAQQTPELATGAACGSSPHMLYSGRDTDDEFFLFYEINYGGIPGRPVGDGMDVHAWWPNVTSIPVEFAESYFPLRVIELRGHRDSGGAGRHRGGNGVYKEYEFLAAGEVSIHDDRAISRPWGIGGGRAAAGSRKILVRGNGTSEELPSKLDFLAVEPGDRLQYITAGGGGWGDPLVRDPEAVRLDVLREFVSSEEARATYGVAVSDGGRSLDLDETQRLRAELGAARPAELPVFDYGPGGAPGASG